MRLGRVCYWLRRVGSMTVTADFVPCPSKSEGWVLQLCGFSSQAYRWLGQSPILSSRRVYELASLPWWESRRGPRACMAHCLGTSVRQDYALSSLARREHQFCSAKGESPGLDSLFRCHCKQVCWMGCAASHVL